MDDEIELEQRPSSMRRIFTLRSTSARQVAVNFMPSRQLPYNTLRLRRNNSEHNVLLEDATEGSDTPDASERQADIIVREMEQHHQLMEDNPEAEELRREALRELPQGLTMKRNVRAKLSASVSLRSKRRPISMMKRLKYRISFAWKRARERARDVVFSIELWYEAIRNIEGHFGSAVGSYFYLVRWLFTLDLILATLVLAFIVLPQILHDQARNVTVDRKFLDFLTGQGWMEDTVLLYGHYHNETISSGSSLTYNMPYAYFFTMLCLYIMVFAVLCYRTAYSYRRNFIEAAGGVRHAFASKVFSGWDFGVVSPRAAALCATSLYWEFKELLNEQNKKQVSASFCTKLGQYLTNTVVTGAVLAAIAGVEYGLWRLLALQLALDNWHLLVSGAVTAAVTLCPLLFHAVVKLEYYRARTALFVTLGRTWMLDVGTLLLLMVYWSRSDVDCWENRFGQEAYRLVLLDAVISLFVLPVVEFIRALIYKLNPSSSAPEFNIAYNSLTLIYNQSVLWFGLLFCPLLVVAVAIKFLLLFYVKRECALRACQPARKVWRAAQTQTVLYMLVTLSLFTTLFAIGSLFLSTSPHACGPFRGHAHVYGVLTQGVLRLHARPALRRALALAARPAVLAFLLLFLVAAVYWVRARARAHGAMVLLLRRMLVLQAKDKDFLLTAIANVSNGEWLYSPKPADSEGPDSHTWKYIQEVRKPSNSGFHFDASRLNHSLLEGRPRSYVKDNRPNSNYTERPKSHGDGDTDSSFSWQGSNNNEGDKKWI